MKFSLYIAGLAFIIVSCSTTRNFSSIMEDDIYYVPGKKALAIREVENLTGHDIGTEQPVDPTVLAGEISRSAGSSTPPATFSSSNNTKINARSGQLEQVNIQSLTREAEEKLANNEEIDMTLYENTGYWIGGYRGPASDLAEIQRIINMYPEGFANFSNGQEIALNLSFDSDWNVYTDNGRYWWFPSNTNINLYSSLLFGTYPKYIWTIVWNNPRFDSWAFDATFNNRFNWSLNLGWGGPGWSIGFGWNSGWYDPWFYSYSPWWTYSSRFYGPSWGFGWGWGGFYAGYYSPWYDPWYGPSWGWGGGYWGGHWGHHHHYYPGYYSTPSRHYSNGRSSYRDNRSYASGRGSGYTGGRSSGSSSLRNSGSTTRPSSSSSLSNGRAGSTRRESAISSGAGRRSSSSVRNSATTRSSSGIRNSSARTRISRSSSGAASSSGRQYSAPVTRSSSRSSSDFSNSRSSSSQFRSSSPSRSSSVGSSSGSFGGGRSSGGSVGGGGGRAGGGRR